MAIIRQVLPIRNVSRWALLLFISTHCDSWLHEAGAQTVPKARYLQDIAVGDINGDRTLDLVTTDFFAKQVIPWLGNGSGSFVQGEQISVAGNPAAVVLGDLDGDGVLDVAVGVLSTNGALTGSVSVYRGTGTGSFYVQTAIQATEPSSLAVADLDHDGVLDLVVVDHAESTVSVLFGDGSLAFTSPNQIDAGPNPYSVVVVDVNKDRRPDLVVSNYVVGASAVSVALGRGGRAFSQAVSYPTTAAAAAIVVADVNQDGNFDVVAATTTDGGISVLFGDGKGGLIPGATGPSGGLGAFSLVALDYDGDRVIDIALANAGSGTVTLVRGKLVSAKGSRTTTFSFDVPKVLLEMQGVWRMAVADVNSDKRKDLVVINQGRNDAISVVLGPPPPRK